MELCKFLDKIVKEECEGKHKEQNNGGKRVPFPFQSRTVALTINKCDIKRNQFNQP